MSCGVSHRCSLDLALLCLWRSPEAAALIGPLAWEPPYASGGALERKNKKKKQQNNAICSNVDGTRDSHTKRSKSERERQIPYEITYT